MDFSPLNPPGVFTCSASVIIDAPKEKVWDILMAFPEYRQWNPFIREQKMVSKSDGKPLPDQTPKQGDHMMLSAHIPPTMNDSSVWFPTNSLELITVLDHANCALAWRYISVPQWLLCAIHWQTLSSVEGGKTKYESVEVFGGVLAYIVKYTMRKGMQKGFEVMGQALKAKSEA